jgi:hypothetical protein
MVNKCHCKHSIDRVLDRRTNLTALRRTLAEDFANPLNRTWVPRLTLVVIRVGAHVHVRRMRGVLRLLWRIADVTWLGVAMSAEFPPSARIGPALGLPHGGRGVSLAPDAQIGANCTIYPFVTIGQDGRSAPPRLEDASWWPLGRGSSATWWSDPGRTSAPTPSSSVTSRRAQPPSGCPLASSARTLQPPSVSPDRSVDARSGRCVS